MTKRKAVCFRKVKAIQGIGAATSRRLSIPQASKM
jgi:hypothetical protein